MLAPVVETPRPVRVSFTGTEAELFRILLRGSALQIPTFGFYRFWLITDVRRHLWSQTGIGADSFEYTGRGKELLIGFLVAMAVLTPVYVAYFLLTLEAERLYAFASAPLVLILYVLGYYALYRARRYRATRTVLRGVRFWMTGSGWAFVGRAVLWDLLTLLTLGLAYPWRSAALERYKIRHTRFGNLEGSFAGSGWTLFRRGGWIWILLLLGLALAGAAALGEQWGIAILFGILVLLPAPLILPIFRAMELRWWLEGIRFGPLQASSDLAIGTVLWCYVKTVLMTMLFGLGASVVLGLVGAIVGGVFVAVVGTEGEMPETASLPTMIAGGFLGVLIYVAFLLGIDIIRRIFLDRGVWAAAAASVTLTGVEALDEVAAAGAAPSSSLGEGLLDALDFGGGV